MRHSLPQAIAKALAWVFGLSAATGACDPAMLPSAKADSAVMPVDAMPQSATELDVATAADVVTPTTYAIDVLPTPDAVPDVLVSGEDAGAANGVPEAGADAYAVADTVAASPDATACGLDISAAPGADTLPLALGKGWDLDLPHCLPAAAAVQLPLPVTTTGSCAATQMKLKLYGEYYNSNTNKLDAFADGSMLLLAHENVLTVSADGLTVKTVTFDIQPVSPPCGEETTLARAADHSAAVIASGPGIVVARRFDMQGNMVGEVVVPTGFDYVFRKALGVDGSLYLLGAIGDYYGPVVVQGLLAVASDGAVKWQRALPANLNLPWHVTSLSVLEGVGLMAVLAMPDGKNFVVIFDNAGELMVRVPTPPDSARPFPTATAACTWGVGSERRRATGDTQAPSWHASTLVARRSGRPSFRSLCPATPVCSAPAMWTAARSSACRAAWRGCPKATRMMSATA